MRRIVATPWVLLSSFSARAGRVWRRSLERAERRADDILRGALRRALTSARLRDGERGAEAEPRWGAVLAAFDVPASHEAVRRLRSIGGPPGRLVLVANSPETYREFAGIVGLQTIRGSNVSHEFSAYDEGLDVLRRIEPDLEVVVLANDRMASYRDTFAEFLGPAVFRLCRDEKLAMGNLDDPGRTFGTPHGTLQRYLRGNLVVLPVSALPNGFRVTSVDPDEYDRAVPARFTPSGTAQASLEGFVTDPDHAAFIWRWLTGGWYRREPLNAASWPRLREKARDILNEHWLTIRLESLGVRPVYAERAAAVAAVTPPQARRRLLRVVAGDVERVGVVRHGDASVQRTAGSLGLALVALGFRSAQRRRACGGGSG